MPASKPLYQPKSRKTLAALNATSATAMADEINENWRATRGFVTAKAVQQEDKKWVVEVTTGSTILGMSYKKTLVFETYVTAHTLSVMVAAIWDMGHRMHNHTKALAGKALTDLVSEHVRNMVENG